MTEKLENFYLRIPEEDRKPSTLIPYFAYYCLLENNEFSVCNIAECFKILALKPYSNISAFLKSNFNGKKPIFIKIENGYVLQRDAKNEISKKLNEITPIPITDNFFQMSLVEDTRDYIKIVAKQMCGCYECGLYDAALVMMRKLIETLIIECFERHGIEDKIKDSEDNFFFLSHLIPAYLKEKEWNASKNIKNISKLKEKGDLSAHNRRFTAKKPDLDACKDELRLFVQDIVYFIDYPKWNETRKTKKAEEKVLI